MGKLLIYLYLTLSSFAFYQLSGVNVMCNGQLCDSDCDNCNLCNADSCKLASGCYCPSTSIPGGIAKENTPQFVFMSLSGGLKESFINQTNFTDTFLKNNSIIDQKGCQVKPSLYITTDESDYNVVNLFQTIGALGFQSVTNKISATSTSTQLNAEYAKGMEFLQTYGQITTNNIKLVRNPNFQLADNYFSAIKSYNFTTDSSIKENPYIRNSSSRVWPYTLDYGLHNQMACTKDCPTSTYSGLWEFLIPTLYDSENNSVSMYELSMANYSASMDIVKKNFQDNYDSNRAPFGLVMNLDWLYLNKDEVDMKKYQFLQEFYSWMGSKDSVLFVSEDQIINWMLNPTAFAITKDSFQCPPKIDLSEACEGNAPTYCDYLNDRSSMGICGPNKTDNVCPEEYPNIRSQACGDGVCTIGLDVCNCSDCGGFCFPNWPGFIEFVPYLQTDTYICGSAVYNNPRSSPAMNFVITVKAYWAKLDKVMGAKYVTFDNNTKDCYSNTWKIKPYLMSHFYPKANYSEIQLCFNKSRSEFEDNFIQLGIEIIQPLLEKNQTLIDYNAECGNGVCQQLEHNLCNSDCFIPFNALWSNKLLVWCLLVISSIVLF